MCVWVMGICEMFVGDLYRCVGCVWVGVCVCGYMLGVCVGCMCVGVIWSLPFS